MAMIKDIVLNLSDEKSGSRATEYAISLAGALEAHIAGVAFVFDPFDLVSHLGYIATDVVDQQWRDYKSEAQAALDRFSQLASRAGVSAEPVMLRASFAGVGDRFGAFARRFDLAVVDQANPEGSEIEAMIIEGALFDSGRPVIIVPYTHRAPLKLDHIMICWDGSRPAARAIADSMPLLARADRIEVVIVANERGKQAEGPNIGRHLARHSLNVDVRRIDHDKIDIADALLSHAADSGADLIVMGGYAHSRLREFVMGGVTRSTLRSMTAPVLMSH
jgi:nucleotide-binding universal stress UspA family protein